MDTLRDEQSYWAFFIRFNKEDLSSTYKPFFIKSLIPIFDFNEQNRKFPGNEWLQKEGSKLKVDLNFIAIGWIKFYGDLIKFRLKQSHTPLDANINRILKEENETFRRRVPTRDSLAEEKFTILRKRVIESTIRPEVLKHVDKEAQLFDRFPGKPYILAELNLVDFFRRYKDILIPSLNFIIVRYLERINFTPRIAEKVSEFYPRDKPTPEQKKIMLSMNMGCFYCPNICTNYYSDHVIPFHYVHRTELFNIVPACERCNSVKSDKLPSKDLFDKVKERNRRLQSLNHLPKEYSDNWYQELYDRCLADFHGLGPLFERIPIGTC